MGTANFGGFTGNKAALNGSSRLLQLAKNDPIGPSRNFSGFARTLRASPGSSGTWTSGNPGYAGVKLANGDYGWVKLEYTTTGTNGPNPPIPGSLELLGYAYENDGGSILAGQTSEPPVSGVPEAGNTTTALLLLP